MTSKRRRSRRQGKIALDRAGFARFMAAAHRLKALRYRVKHVMVRPNARLFATGNYRKADTAFNAALSADARTASLMPLFLVESNPTGQGRSLFTEKPNVRPDEFDMVLNIDALHFAEALKSTVASQYGLNHGPVVLRMDNEGAEVEGIHAFPDDRDIPFLPLHSDFATWRAVAEKTLALLDSRQAAVSRLLCSQGTASAKAAGTENLANSLTSTGKPLKVCRLPRVSTPDSYRLPSKNRFSSASASPAPIPS